METVYNTCIVTFFTLTYKYVLIIWINYGIHGHVSLSQLQKDLFIWYVFNLPLKIISLLQRGPALRRGETRKAVGESHSHLKAADRPSLTYNWEAAHWSTVMGLFSFICIPKDQVRRKYDLLINDEKLWFQAIDLPETVSIHIG